MSRSKVYLEELGHLARLAAPLAAIHAGTQLMSLVDVAVVGRSGAVPLAAIGLGNALFFTISILGIGAMMGMDPLIAQALGAGEPTRARRYLWQSVWLSLLLTLGLLVPIVVSPSLLVPCGIEPAVADQARTYVLIRTLGLYPTLLFVGVRAYLQAMGLTRPLFVAMFAANVLNLGADVLLVFGGAGLPAWAGPLRLVPALGIAGAALATTLCAVLQLVVVAWAVKAVAVPGFTAAMRRPLRADIARALRVGVPIGLQMLAECSVFALVGLLVGRMGTDKMAAHQISLTLASFSFMVSVGIGAAASVRVGRAVGAQDLKAVRIAGFTAIVASTAWMSLSALIFVAWPGALAGLMSHDPEVLRLAAPLLAVAAVFQLSDGVQAVTSGILRGAGDTRYPFIANVIGYYVLSLPLGLFLSARYGMGAQGLWWGLCVGLTLIAVALVARFVKLSSKPIAPV